MQSVNTDLLLSVFVWNVGVMGVSGKIWRYTLSIFCFDHRSLCFHTLDYLKYYSCLCFPHRKC